MQLNVVPSKGCGINRIRLSKRMLRDIGVEYGDWLVFDVKSGPLALMVSPADAIDLELHGQRVAFVSTYCPVLDSDGGDVYTEPHHLTIGCDPEFLLVSPQNGRVIEANRILPYEGSIGNDGELMEIRPDYALCPQQLVENIRSLLKRVPWLVPKAFVSCAASWYKHFCCGFHVHLGMPQELLTFAVKDTDKILQNLVTLLDYFVGIPAMALDCDEHRRSSRQYGKAGDYRLNMRTLEYRTPGGVHLATPEQTDRLLQTSFCLAEKFVKDVEKISDEWTDVKQISEFDFWADRYSTPSINDIKKIFLTKDRDLLSSHGDKAISQLEQLTEYKDKKFDFDPKQPIAFLKNWCTGDET